jgi:hypothetical protein
MITDYLNKRKNYKILKKLIKANPRENFKYSKNYMDFKNHGYEGIDEQFIINNLTFYYHSNLTQEAWGYGVIKNNQKVNLTYSQSESLFELIKNKKINL